MRFKLLLSDGTAKIAKANQYEQVRVRDIDSDFCLACELLNAAPCDVRYGWVHFGEGIKIIKTIYE